jgi:hypothetical protein
MFCNLVETPPSDNPASCHLFVWSQMRKTVDADARTSLRSNAWAADQHLTVPAKALSEDEYELLQEWVAACSTTVTAYVSRRAADNSALLGRIVVVDGKTRKPLYLVYSPLDANSWTVASVMEQAEISEFPTLYAALSFVRPVRILHPIAALKATPKVSEA